MVTMAHQQTPQRAAGRPSIGGRTSFPILHPSEIIQALAGLNIEISKDELVEPHRNREKLRNIFLQLLNLCTGKSEEDLIVGAPVLDASVTIVDEYSTNLHLDAQQYVEIKLFLALRQLFETCGYNDFSWRDLYGTPTPKRLQYQLSAICNLAGNFLNEQVKVYAELSENRHDLIAALTQNNKDNQDLKEEYAQEELKAQASGGEVEQIMQECQELELEIARNNELQSASREESTTLKKQLNDLKDELATAVWGLQEAQAEEEEWRMQVVTSPDRRKAAVQRNKEELDKQKMENAKLDTQLQEVKQKIMRLEQANKEFVSVEMQLAELIEQMNKYKEIISDMETTLEQIKANEKEFAVTQGETEEAKHVHKRCEEKIISQRKQHKLQIEAAQEALDTAKAQLLGVEKERREAMLRRESSEEEIRNLEQAMKEQRAKTEQEIQALVQEYKEAEQAFLERNEKRMQLLGIVAQ